MVHPADDVDDAEVRERFLVEGRLLARLSHPRIVKVTDFGTDEASGRPYFVMDLVLNERGEMQLLSDVEPGTVDEERVGMWYDDLRAGLAYIHATGVVHRDLKLQNVLIGSDGHAVITDFGISKIFDAKGDGVPIIDTVKTLVKIKEGRSLVMGSVGYMAPELEMGVAASPASDWYALGVIVYRLLTGFWCDARTDVVGTLETFDPVWKRIIPKLLHANPHGRMCLSFADEQRADREAAELEAENRWLREKSRGHFARHAARWIALGFVLSGVAFAFLSYRNSAELRLARSEREAIRQECAALKAGSVLRASGRSPYDFDEIFTIPAEAKAEPTMDAADEIVLVPSREELTAARIDILVLTHEIFSRLNAGEDALEVAIGKLERLTEKFGPDADPFDEWPEGYNEVGETESTYWLLERGLERLKELAES